MAAQLTLVTEGEGREARTLATLDGWELCLWQEAPDQEPRIRDLDAAERLGFSRPRDIRKLIERTWPGERLQALYCRATVARQSTGNGASREYEVTEYWLTEAQLLKLIARSRTEVAEAILDDMIRVYRLVRGSLGASASLPAPPATPTPSRDTELGLLAAKAREEVDGQFRRWLEAGGTLRSWDEAWKQATGLTAPEVLTALQAGRWDPKLPQVARGVCEASRQYAEAQTRLTLAQALWSALGVVSVVAIEGAQRALPTRRAG